MSSVSSGSVNDHFGIISEQATTTDFTVMCRYKLASLPAGTRAVFICTKSDLSEDIELDLQSDGTLVLAAYQSGSYQYTQAAGSLSTGVNHHIAIVHDQGVTTTAYLDGSQIAQITGITFTMNEWGIGAGGAAPSFTAEDPKAWTATLSGAEVAAEIAVMAAQRSSNLWDWWDFNSTIANFGVRNGQVNGAARQVKYQGDFTYSADQLAPGGGGFLNRNLWWDNF